MNTTENIEEEMKYNPEKEIEALLKRFKECEKYDHHLKDEDRESVLMTYFFNLTDEEKLKVIDFFKDHMEQHADISRILVRGYFDSDKIDNKTIENIILLDADSFEDNDTGYYYTCAICGNKQQLRYMHPFSHIIRRHLDTIKNK